MLVGKNDLKNKFLNYKELCFYIRTRCKSYYNCEVSPTHIAEITFRFKGTIDNFEGENSCAVCLEGYEIDQEVCRLPCDHFCCRSCTIEMFNIPNDGSRANFQCPVCRDDCSQLLWGQPCRKKSFVRCSCSTKHVILKAACSRLYKSFRILAFLVFLLFYQIKSS